MKSRRPILKTTAGGFTLLELLLATAVGAIVLLVINTTFFSALRLQRATHERIDDDLGLERALTVIRRDLAGIVIPGNPEATTNAFSGQLTTELYSQTTLDGASERITPDIYTSSGAIDGWTPFAEVQMVAYFLAPAADGGPNRDLVRLVTRNLLPATEAVGEPQVLLPNVILAGMSYYDGANWIETWDSATSGTLPTAIKFAIVPGARGVAGSSVDPSPIELVVPVLVTTVATEQETVAAAATTP